MLYSVHEVEVWILCENVSVYFNVRGMMMMMMTGVCGGGRAYVSNQSTGTQAIFDMQTICLMMCERYKQARIRYIPPNEHYSLAYQIDSSITTEIDWMNIEHTTICYLWQLEL